MKEAKPRAGRSPSADSGAAKEVEAYLAEVPEPARRTLSKIRAMIRSAAPAEAAEAISYGIPAFKYKGALVAYAAFADHCSLFPMNPAVIEALRGQLKGYATSKGTIRFPVDQPLPAALVKKIVKARVAENEQRKRR